MRDVNGDGAADLIVRAVLNGKRRHKVFDAVTLASLPPVLALTRPGPIWESSLRPPAPCTARCVLPAP
jgi:hypothetical protein